jgi:hypothetical protein
MALTRRRFLKALGLGAATAPALLLATHSAPIVLEAAHQPAIAASLGGLPPVITGMSPGADSPGYTISQLRETNITWIIDPGSDPFSYRPFVQTQSLPSTQGATWNTSDRNVIDLTAPWYDRVLLETLENFPEIPPESRAALYKKLFSGSMREFI